MPQVDTWLVFAVSPPIVLSILSTVCESQVDANVLRHLCHVVHHRRSCDACFVQPYTDDVSFDVFGDGVYQNHCSVTCGCAGLFGLQVQSVHCRRLGCEHGWCRMVHSCGWQTRLDFNIRQSIFAVCFVLCNCHCTAHSLIHRLIFVSHFTETLKATQLAMPTSCEYVVDKLVEQGIDTFFLLTGGVSLVWS